MWSFTTPVELPADFYEYTYLVTFDDGTVRRVSDPCTRYGGSADQRAAFVIGGSRPADNQVAPLAHGRPAAARPDPLRAASRRFHRRIPRHPRATRRAPRQARLPARPGINAILCMPWTTWQNEAFDWGYTPSSTSRSSTATSTTRCSRPRSCRRSSGMIDACHERDIHVIMDGVFNHVHPDFPYKYLYRDPTDCPFTGTFGGTFPGLQDLNFNTTLHPGIHSRCLHLLDRRRSISTVFGSTIPSTSPAWRSTRHPGPARRHPHPFLDATQPGAASRTSR